MNEVLLLRSAKNQKVYPAVIVQVGKFMIIKIGRERLAVNHFLRHSLPVCGKISIAVIDQEKRLRTIDARETLEGIFARSTDQNIQVAVIIDIARR